MQNGKCKRQKEERQFQIKTPFYIFHSPTALGTNRIDTSGMALAWKRHGRTMAIIHAPSIPAPYLIHVYVTNSLYKSQKVKCKIGSSIMWADWEKGCGEAFYIFHFSFKLSTDNKSLMNDHLKRYCQIFIRLRR
jgi:hypothetical protein